MSFFMFLNSIGSERSPAMPKKSILVERGPIFVSPPVPRRIISTK